MSVLLNSAEGPAFDTWRLFRPIELVANVCGIPLNLGRKEEVSASPATLRCRLKRVLLYSYACVVFALSVLTLVRVCLFFPGTKVVDLFLPLQYFDLKMISVFLLAIMFYERKSMAYSVEIFDSFIQMHGADSYLLKARRKLCVLMAFSITGMLTYIIFLGVYTSEVSGGKWILSPFTNVGGGLKVAWLVVIIFVDALHVNIYLIFIMFYLLFAAVLSKEFSRVSTAARSLSNWEENAAHFKAAERLRLRHEELVSLVDRVNRSTRHLASSTLVLSLGLVCFNIYILANNLFTPIQILPLGIATSLQSATSVFVLLTAAYMNAKAHEPREHLLKIRLDDLDEKTIQIINIFLARLSGPSIGFSVYGLFTLDMNAILMIGGTLCAYIFVVLQFNVTAPKCP